MKLKSPWESPNLFHSGALGAVFSSGAVCWLLVEILDAWCARILVIHVTHDSQQFSCAAAHCRARTRVILVSSRIFNAANLSAKSARNSILRRCLRTARPPFLQTLSRFSRRQRFVSVLSCKLLQLLLSTGFRLIQDRSWCISRLSNVSTNEVALPLRIETVYFAVVSAGREIFPSGNIANWLVKNRPRRFRDGVCELERSAISAGKPTR